jgi:hypothetical protein
MKSGLKAVWILLGCLVVLGLGLGIRALLLRGNITVKGGMDERLVYAAVDEFDFSTSSDVVEADESVPRTPPVAVESIEPGLDLKRGSFLTDEIMVQLDELVAEETIGGIWVGASRIVHGDTRAFVRICMALDGSPERLMFGGPIRLDYPGGSSEAFFVHNDVPDERRAACEVLEFVGVVPENDRSGWRFTMENVMFTIPDEGTECDVYQKRAEADKRLQDAGVTVACSHSEGVTSLEIASKSAGLSMTEARKLMEDAAYGRYRGPWVYNLPVEVGLVRPGD